MVIFHSYVAATLVYQRVVDGEYVDYMDMAIMCIHM